MKRIILCFLASCWLGQIQAQLHQDVLPSLQGPELEEALKDEYRPGSVPGSSQGKDILYRDVFGKFDNIITGVYSGFTITLNPNADPSEDVFSKGINLEHTYPKSAVTNGPAELDLHNLFPSKVEVNQARGSLPFLELDDENVDEWFFEDQEITNIPNSNINDWSEVEFNVGFEPRDEHKGNVARAMFYTYTIYRNEALNEDPDFFEIQRETLCQWHAADPVDADEWVHTWRIAGFQEGKPNPFILDCTLPVRTYCDGVIDACVPVSTEEVIETPLSIAPNSPNPFTEKTTIAYTLNKSMKVRVSVYNALGQLVSTLVDTQQLAGLQTVDWYANQHGAGLYFYKIDGTDGEQVWQQTGWMVKQ